MSLDRRTQAYDKKDWAQRISEYPNRRDLMNAEDGTFFKTVSVVRNEGTVMQEGDAFTKSTMDDMENRINEAFVAEHTFMQATLAKNGTYVEFGPNSIIDNGIIPHIYVPMAYNKLIPESYVLDATNHKLRVNFAQSSTASLPAAGILIKLKVEYDLTPQI